ncbi:sterol desaturase family protein [Methylocystis parvus]|uniref:Sterol desaturase family protein n=1 Tax=Methylocystis parvus TaxID=134 RepID=A0A6B8M033_9HYPH|nr:sterol desaturase family protein [Methylocystis parvus]QGM96171.1 sterol desaturase family protein [Methylocystis parvus]WBK00004.1 sterol desaturase family protein [Methylocystis parvus OBBP]
MDLSSAIRLSASRIWYELFLPGSIFSVYSLTTSLSLGLFALAYRQKKRRGRVGLRALLRAVAPGRFFMRESFHADVKLLALSVVLMPSVVGALVISSQTIAKGVHALLTGAFGTIAPCDCDALFTKIVATIVLFLAYEIGYWIDHYLKHRVPFLWELHKLHHTADVLTPVTNFRNHPIDNIVFGWMLALFIGSAAGALEWAFGQHADIFAVNGKNILFLAFLWTIGHLQHSQFWIPFRGIWGRLILSPAHHQIHHSNDPKHFNRNFGSVLAVWDWMFGTLEVPTEKNPRIAFGVEEEGVNPHSTAAMLATPVIKSAAALWRALICVFFGARRLPAEGAQHQRQG